MDFNASGDGGQKISRNSNKEQDETIGFPIQNGQSSSSPHKNGSKKPVSGIPRLRVKKKGYSDSGKSVIYGPMSHSLKNKAKNGSSSSMKGPWVPAPAKSTTGTHVDFLQFNQKNNKKSPRLYSAPLDFNSLRDEDETSNISGSIASYPIDIPKRNKVLGTSKFRFKSRSSCSSNSPDRKGRISSLNKKSKRKVRISSSGYTLKSKDSLIDVTAFLHSKREEIMRLWEHYLTGGDDELLSIFQEANRLALEAANEVETLRKSIQELHKKDSSLSESDCDLLDKLRNQVLGKIKEFENANSKVQEHVSKTVFQDSNETKTIKDKPKSLPNVGKSKSMSSISKHNVHENEEVVFIKQKSSAFEIPQLSESEISDNDKFYNEFKVINSINKRSEKGIKATANPSQSNTTAKTNPSTIVDLSKLTRMYEEQYEMPPLNFTSGKEQVVTTDVAHSSRSVRFHHTTNDECDIQVLKNQIDSLIKVLGSKKENLVAARKASKTESFYENSSSSPERESGLNPKLYKEKVQQLEAQLLDAETEMVQLKDELERVESESNYQVRRLQSSFEDRLETLENFPEYLEFSEQRLLRSLQEKAKLEATIEVKDKEAEKLKDSNKCLLEKMEIANGKLANFEKIRLEIDTKDKEIAKLSSKLETLNLKCFNHDSVPTKHYWDNQGKTLKHVIKKNEKLELKIEELRNSLAKAHKNIHIVQVSKEKMMARMTLRQEDILSELEQAREKNRKLKNQIYHIRSKYHELFPFGMINIRANNEKPEETMHNTNLKSHSPSSQKRKKEKEKGQKSQFQMHYKPVVDEPLVNQITTWITGNETEDDKGTFVLESESENEKWAARDTEQRRNLI